MNSHPRAFEPSDDLILASAAPLPCPRKMHAQDITPWTPARLAAALLRALQPVPASAPLSVSASISANRRA